MVVLQPPSPLSYLARGSKYISAEGTGGRDQDVVVEEGKLQIKSKQIKVVSEGK